MSLITIYHGTDISSAKAICNSNGPKINIEKGSRTTDFGQGFYTTDDYDRAVIWAKRKARVRKREAAVVILLFDEQSAKPLIQYFLIISAGGVLLLTIVMDNNISTKLRSKTIIWTLVTRLPAAE